MLLLLELLADLVGDAGADDVDVAGGVDSTNFPPVAEDAEDVDRLGEEEDVTVVMLELAEHDSLELPLPPCGNDSSFDSLLPAREKKEQMYHNFSAQKFAFKKQQMLPIRTH